MFCVNIFESYCICLGLTWWADVLMGIFFLIDSVTQTLCIKLKICTHWSEVWILSCENDWWHTDVKKQNIQTNTESIRLMQRLVRAVNSNMSNWQIDYINIHYGYETHKVQCPDVAYCCFIWSVEKVVVWSPCPKLKMDKYKKVKNWIGNLFEVVKSWKDDFMTSSNKTDSSKELQDQCFCPGSAGKSHQYQKY